MAKAKKQTKKFQQRHLKRTIDDRKAHQKKKAVIDRAKKAKELRSNKSRRAAGGDDDDEGGAEEGSDDDEEAQLEEGDDAEPGASSFKGMSVEDFLGGGFKAGLDGDEDDGDGDAEDDDDDEEDEMSELEELSDGEGHAQDLEKLKEKDPEFYKFLQENDKDLLNFGAEEDSEDEEDEEDDEDDSDEDMEAAPALAKGKGKMTAEQEAQEVVTTKMLRGWQKDMIQQRSLKALRKLLLAFKSAAHMDDPDGAGSSQMYAIEEATVFNKLIITVLKYTPVVLQHHIPAKETAQGKFKLPTNNKKFALLQRPIQIYFANLHHLLRTITEPEMLYVAVTESAKMVPFVMNNRRMAREYIKVLLDLWSSAADRVRIAAFLSVRKVAQAGDEAMIDMCLRGAYQSFIRSTKLTTVHTLPSINLMKNSASELYSLDTAASYQQAFSFIRQLAVHLRNALKTRSADSFKSVYNWQYLHCIDFWSIVLATACDRQRLEERGEVESELQQLIYPLVQVALGAIRLIPTSRYFPLRMHLLRSLLRLMQRTGVYIPLGASLLEMLSSPEFTRKAKGSTLKPLDFTTTLRAPAAYVRTRVYVDQLAEEVPHLLLEFLATQARSIALPELVVPLTVQLRRTLKHGSSPKLSTICKQLLSKLDANVRFVENKRRAVDFAPNNLKGVQSFLSDLDEKMELPLEGALRLARKVREQKRKLVEEAEQRV
ncbi:Noc2-domain-containing protein [Microstroma glucosiphilum]|uniref:Noc2-domain-containing protein n=1 Tax=Pseudomicrostroma glucosiphilum TaxID=1684307 RepID=A0A316U7H4_9BASI|nr:Noc2-domain-containing protein [Pseudomicrostroma glucosiphilum]PWN21196.1 Noc2-domain-containing protein [Pseudomicrostroma glucosiphilum]